MRDKAVSMRRPKTAAPVKHPTECEEVARILEQLKRYDAMTARLRGTLNNMMREPGVGTLSLLRDMLAGWGQRMVTESVECHILALRLRDYLSLWLIEQDAPPLWDGAGRKKRGK